MKINILTIPHSEQRYETAGDWWFDEAGDLQIRVSDMGNTDYEYLVGLHELVEAKLCKNKGIEEKDVTAFDIKFEEMRKAFPDLIGDDEPGNHPRAPYNLQHQIASRIEVSQCQDLKVDWFEFGKAIEALSQTPKVPEPIVPTETNDVQNP